MTDRAADTPLIRQYREIKAQHTDAILFFRMGDFYEMFFDDAQLASRELGLTLTARNNGATADVPLAGIPVKAATDYLRKLVSRGHRVAICEQVEDPRTAKGIVRREVVETITPGAVITDTLLDGVENNFLVAAYPGAADSGAGIAALDVSTGEFVLETVAPHDLAPSVQRYAPRELVLPTEATHLPVDAVMITSRDAWEFDPELGADDLTRRFALAGLDGLGIEATDRPAVAAAGALLRYAAELQPGGLPHIRRPTVHRPGGTMALDEMTRRNLELVEPLRATADQGTLLDCIDETRTPMGARLLRQWLLAPLTTVAPIHARLDAVGVCAVDARGRGDLREALDGVRDIERLTGRIAARRASPRDLGALRNSLARLPHVQTALETLEDRTRSTVLERALTEFDRLTDLHETLAHALRDELPAAIGDADTIRPGADPELDAIRDLRDGGKRYIAGLQAQERERTGISNLKVGFNRVFGYYIEVTKSHRAAVPDHYDRRQTLTNAERFITPELKEYEARVLGAEEQAGARERELVEQLCAAVDGRVGRLQATARMLAEMDVLAGFAETACRHGYVRPTVTDDFALDLTQCRHPVVERMLPSGKFIPNDVRLDERTRVMLLTGPNMAGKSTILRQVGLCVILAQVGAFVPAAAATIGVTDRVFTRVGASDNLGRGQSTFMVEMTETSAILHAATDRSLALLDEIGRGTSTYDGVAIAWAVTEYLHGAIGAKTVFATHYHELTQLTEELEHACNCNVAVREVGDDIVFLHQLVAGGADRSYGIHVGRLAGLPPDVVARAWEILHRLESGHHVTETPLPLRPDASQLPLFDHPDPILEDLRTLNVNDLTPLDALNRLADLQRRAGERS